MDSVLVVDDEHSVRELLHSILSRRHWVATAASADEAIEMLALGNYGVLITDLRMRGPDGLDLIAEATARWPEIRTVLLSGFIDDDVRERAETLAVSAVLEKPFDAVGLAATVDSLLAEARAESGAASPEVAAG